MIWRKAANMKDFDERNQRRKRAGEPGTKGPPCTVAVMRSSYADKVAAGLLTESTKGLRPFRVNTTENATRV
jgi:hypothetical protein